MFRLPVCLGPWFCRSLPQTCHPPSLGPVCQTQPKVEGVLDKRDVVWEFEKLTVYTLS